MTYLARICPAFSILLTLLLVTPCARQLSAQDKGSDAGGVSSVTGPENDLVPTFRFESSAIDEWLLVGPVKYDARPEDPVAFFNEVREGEQVEFSDGTRRNWTRETAQDFAYVALDKYCRSQGDSAADMVVYAACTFVANKTETRSFFHGADDACKLWVDGELMSETEFGFYSVTTRKFQVDVEAQQPRTILVEVRNHGGNFGFGVASGETWTGTATYANTKTPSPEALVQLRDKATGRAVDTTRSGPLGGLKFELVPYESGVAIYEGSRQLPIEWSEDSQGQRQFRVTAQPPANFRTVDLLPADYNSSHPIETVFYSPKSGRIYFAEEDSLSLLRVLNGQTVSVHPDSVGLPAELMIQGIAVTDDETIFVRTIEFGLLVFTDTGLLQFGGLQALPGVQQMPAPEGVLVRKEDRLTQYLGDAWVTAGCDRNVLGGEKGDHAARSSTGIYRISVSNRKASLIAKPNGGVLCFEVCQSGLAYATEHTIGHRDDPLKGPFEVTDAPVPGVRELCFDSRDRLTLLGRKAVAIREKDGSWQTLSYVPRAYTPGDLTTGKDSWICTNERVLQFENGQLHAVPLTDHWKSSTGWANEGLVVGTVSGRILGVENGGVTTFGVHEGLVAPMKQNVDVSPWGSVLSGQEMPAQHVDGTELALVYGSRSKVSFHLDENHVVCFGSLSTKLRHVQVARPFCYTSLKGDQKIWRVPLPTTAPSLRMRNFCRIGDGKGLLATDQGLFVIGPKKAELESHQTADSPLRLDAMTAFDDGEVWLGDMEGRFCSLANSSNQDQWIELPSRAAFQRVTQFAKPSWTSQDELLVGTTLGLYSYEPSSGTLEIVSAPFGETAYIQDIEASEATGSVIVSVRNMGVYVLHEGVWAHVNLGEQIDTSMSWDVAVEPSGDFWLTTNERFIRVSHQSRDLFCFLDKVNTGDGWQASTAGATAELERDGAFRALLSTSSPIGHAGFRYRADGGQWNYLNADQRELELAMTQVGSVDIEVQAFDHYHNFSPAVVFPVDVFLPMWRWQMLRWAAASLLLLGAAVTVYSYRASRLARHRQLEAERANALGEKQRRTLAEHAAQERERLLLRVCHDLKNPLNVVFACTEMLDSGELNAEEAAPLLNGSAESMDYLSKQLLSYSKAKRGADIEKRLVSTHELIDDLRRQYDLTRRDGGKLEIQIDADTPHNIMTDPRMVNEILGNLLENAIKHCPGGVVQLGLANQDGKPTFFVQDDGPGIDALELDSIFSAFYQSATTEHKQDGLGLGLSICKTLAERLGGKLGVESELRHGARFSFELPCSCVVPADKLAAQQRQTEEASQEPHAPEFLGGFSELGLTGRILVVDDQEYVASTMVQRLNKMNIEAKYVGPADAVAEALAGYSQNVLIDLNMPGQNGFKLAQELRKHCGDSLILIAMSESEQLVELADEFDYFDRVLPKSRLFEMLGRTNHAPGGSHQAVM